MYVVRILWVACVVVVVSYVDECMYMSIACCKG